MRHHPDEVWVRFSLREDEPRKKLNIMRPRQTTMGQSIPRELYHGQVLLKAAKVKHLKKIASQFVPPVQRTFYFQLKNNGWEDGNSTDEDPVKLILKSNSNKIITLAYHYKRKWHKEPISIQSNYSAAGAKRGKYTRAGHDWRVLLLTGLTALKNESALQLQLKLEFDLSI